MRSGRPREFDREQALQAAMELFWKHGFEGTSKRHLMEAMGLGSQSLYNAFGDKRSLFLEACDHYAQCIFQELGDALTGEESALESARAVVRSWGSEAEDGCLLANTAGEMGSADPEITRFLHAQMARAVELFAATLERAVNQGELPPGTNVKQLAMTLFAIRGGLSLMTRLGAAQEAVDLALEGALQLLDRRT